MELATIRTSLESHVRSHVALQRSEDRSYLVAEWSANTAERIRDVDRGTNLLLELHPDFDAAVRENTDPLRMALWGRVNKVPSSKQSAGRCHFVGWTQQPSAGSIRFAAYGALRWLSGAAATLGGKGIIAYPPLAFIGACLDGELGAPTNEFLDYLQGVASLAVAVSDDFAFDLVWVQVQGSRLSLVFIPNAGSLLALTEWLRNELREQVTR